MAGGEGSAAAGRVAAGCGAAGCGAGAPQPVLACGAACKEDAYAVRRAVFMDEQGYRDEFDAVDEDPACVHVVAYRAGAPVGCARVFPARLERPDAAPDEVHLGRLAVLPAHRGHGIATALIRRVHEVARAMGVTRCTLHAQVHAVPLYRACGYAPVSEVDYEDEGQPHVWMAREL